MEDTHLFFFSMENGKQMAHVCYEDSLLCVCEGGMFGCVPPLANASLIFCVCAVIAMLIKAKRRLPQRDNALHLLTRAQVAPLKEK